MPLKQLFGTIQDGQHFVDENGQTRLYCLSMIAYGTPQVDDMIVYEENGKG